MNKALQIASNFVVMNTDLDAESLAVSDNFYAELDKKYGNFAGHTLISCHSFNSDWPTWECHPNGDELVILLDGEVEMRLAKDDGDESVRLATPGEFVIVPRGTWHTARVQREARMLFVTPGEATENLEQPPAREA